MKDKLFIMKPGFVNAGLGPYYCGDSVSVEGFLSFFPEVREKVEVIYIEFPRPRTAIVDLIGEDNQSVPVLVLADKSSTDNPAVETGKQKYFIADEKEIRNYLSAQFGLPKAG